MLEILAVSPYFVTRSKKPVLDIARLPSSFLARGFFFLKKRGS